MSLRNPLSIGPNAGVMASFPRALTTPASPVASGTGNLRLSFFTASSSRSFASIQVRMGGTAAAATPTLCRLGLWLVGDDDALVSLVAATPNDTTLWSTGTVNAASTKAFSSPASVIQGSRYAAGLLCVSAAATPTFVGMTFGHAATAGVAQRENGFIASQTDLPTSVAAGGIADSTSNILFLLVP